jgi:beta-glucosidase
LVGFDRISLRPRERRTMTFTITPRQMSLIDEHGKRIIEPGEFMVGIGGGKASFRVTGNFTEVGER